MAGCNFLHKYDLPLQYIVEKENKIDLVNDGGENKLFAINHNTKKLCIHLCIYLHYFGLKKRNKTKQKKCFLLKRQH